MTKYSDLPNFYHTLFVKFSEKWNHSWEFSDIKAVFFCNLGTFLDQKCLPVQKSSRSHISSGQFTEKYEPAEKPYMVMFSESPPKLWICWCTHFRANCWSLSPRFSSIRGGMLMKPIRFSL